MQENKLPTVNKKKRIDKDKFIILAKKVRKILEEEQKELEKKRDESTTSTRLLFDIK